MLNKNRGAVAAIFASGLRVLRALYHRPDTLCAHDLAYLAAVFNHQNLLEIGLEGTPGGAQ
jgi:hypothetical protein